MIKIDRRSIKRVPRLRFPGFSDEWEEKKLGDLNKKKLSNGVFNDPAKVGNGYRLINVKDMYVDGYIDVTTLTKVAINKGEFLRNKIISGDIFFTRSSLVKEGIAYTNIYLGDYDDITFDGHLIKMSPDKNTVYPLFIYYLSKTNPIRRQLVAYGNTTTMTTIGQTEVSIVDVAVPPLGEQKKIAEFLTVVDDKISALRSKKELLQKYKKGTMQAMFTQTIRFKDENGKNYPAWQEEPIGDTAQFVNGYTFRSSTYDNKGEYKVVTIANVQDGHMSFKRVNRIKELPGDIQNKQVLEIGDILISMTGNVGRTCRVTEQKCLLNQRVGKIVSSREVSQDFLFFVLSSKRFIIRMIALAQGGAQDNLSMKDIMKYSFELPVKEEQEKIADFLTTIDDKINLTKKGLEQAKEFKKALLQQMFV